MRMALKFMVFPEVKGRRHEFQTQRVAPFRSVQVFEIQLCYSTIHALLNVYTEFDSSKEVKMWNSVGTDLESAATPDNPSDSTSPQPQWFTYYHRIGSSNSPIVWTSFISKLWTYEGMRDRYSVQYSIAFVPVNEQMVNEICFRNFRMSDSRIVECTESYSRQSERFQTDSAGVRVTTTCI